MNEMLVKELVFKPGSLVRTTRDFGIIIPSPKNNKNTKVKSDEFGRIPQNSILLVVNSTLRHKETLPSQFLSQISYSEEAQLQMSVTFLYGEKKYSVEVSRLPSSSGPSCGRWEGLDLLRNS